MTSTPAPSEEEQFPEVPKPKAKHVAPPGRKKEPKRSLWQRIWGPIKYRLFLAWESPFSVRMRNRWWDQLKAILKNVLVVLFSTACLWLMLHLLHIIKLTALSFVETAALYFVLEELKALFLVRTAARGKGEK